MNKVNIANYVVYDLSNKFSGLDNGGFNNEIVEMIANSWHKKHYVDGINKNVKHRYNEKIRQTFLMWKNKISR